MAHVAQGDVSAQYYNTVQDKIIPLSTDVQAESLLVAISAGHGVDATIGLTGVSDSGGNTWDSITVSAGGSSRFVMIAWARITAAMDSSDTVTINLQGSFVRSFAVLRAFQGLGATEYDKDSAIGYGNPALMPALSHSGAGRAIAVGFYSSDSFSTDWWANGFTQTVNYNSFPNLDTITVGERSIAGTSSVTPRINVPTGADWGMVGVTLPEQAMSSGRNIMLGMM